jgi:hypothetical protein
MNVIHTQAGTVQEPLTTLADQLSETSKQTLQQTAQAAFSQAPAYKRLGWWAGENAALTIPLFFLAGLVGGAIFARQWRGDSF